MYFAILHLASLGLRVSTLFHKGLHQKFQMQKWWDIRFSYAWGLLKLSLLHAIFLSPLTYIIT